MGSNVARVPDNTRTFDSAVYAHALLARHVRPDPAAIRLSDFINYDAYSPPYDASAPAKNVSIDLSYDSTTGQGLVVGRLVTRPDGPAKPLGMVIVLDTSASMAPLRDVELAAAQALLEELSPASGDDAVIRTWESGPLGGLTDTAAMVLSDARAHKASLPVDQSNNLAAMLESAAADARKLGGSPGSTRHVVVFTGGGASAANAESMLRGYKKEGLVLDVIAVASEPALEKTPYNALLLQAMTAHGGARLLVTDALKDPNGAPGVYSDVSDVIVDRFNQSFREAYTATRVVFTLPSILTPASLALDPNNGASSTLSNAEASPLRDIAVGFGRGFEFRQLVKATPGTNVFNGGCGGGDEIDARFQLVSGAETVELPVKALLTDLAAGSPAQRYDAALVAFVTALREATAQSNQSVVDARMVIQKVVTHDCGGATATLDTSACTRLARMLSDLGAYP